MATDENPSVDPQEDPPETPPADPPVDDKPDLTAKELSQAKKEAQNLRARLRAAEKLAQDEKTRADTLDSEKSDLLSKVQRSQAERAIVDAARDPQVGAKRPEAIADLIDLSKLKFEDSGVGGVAEEIARVKAKFPELFNTTGSADGAAGKDPITGDDMNNLIRRSAGRA